MALNLPSPNESGKGFLEGLDTGSTIMNRLMQNKQTQAKLNLPFGGATVTGPAGHIVGLQMLKDAYGENSQQYQDALKAFNLSQESTGSRINYQNVLSNSLPLRYTTTEGKKVIEQSNVHGGYSPAGTPQGQPIAPGQAAYHEPNKPNFPTPGYTSQGQPISNVQASQNPKDEVLNGVPGAAVNPTQPSQPEIPPTNNGAPSVEDSYTNNQAKANLPASVMQKNLYATNIEKTIDATDLDALTYYNNPLGQIQLKYEQAQDALGRPTSQEFKNYVKASKTFDFLSNQVRQFYGDSIQPSAMEKLQEKLDPRSGYKSSKTAQEGYKSATDLLKSELKTYRDAATNSNVYTGRPVRPSKANANNGSGYSEGKRPPADSSWMKRPDGQIVAVHNEWKKEMQDKYNFSEVE